MEIQLKEILMLEQHQNTLGTWIPLMDFALKKGVSLSTLRRHIKAKKLTYKIEDGRYLLWDNEEENVEKEPESNELKIRLATLTNNLQKAQEEIAELKTLIALYEEKILLHRLDH